jgi:tetratricopeptide (TPR) repeat protein
MHSEVRMYALVQAVSAPADDPATIFRQGKEAMEGGQMALAEDRFRRVIALDSKSSAAHVNLGVVFMRQKRWNEALTELRIAQSLTSNQPGISLNIGLVYYKSNRFSSAIEPLSAALRESPDSLQARYLLGLCYFFTNQYKLASDSLAPLWTQESSNLNYLYVLSIAASKAKNLALQQQAFGQMLIVGQDTAEFHLYLGKAWLAEDDTGKALKEFNAAAASKPDLPLVHYFLGRAHLQRHEYSQAEVELQKDIALEPELPYNYEDLGLMYALLNQPSKAESFFRQAIAQNGDLVNSYFGLAKLYRDEARYQEALDPLTHALALAPNSASVHFTMGQVLKGLGQTQKANQEYQTAGKLLKSFNDSLQQDQSADRIADAQNAAQE